MRESLLEKEDENAMECGVCGKRKLSVSERPDAYTEDVHNEVGATHTVCDECDYQNSQDI